MTLNGVMALFCVISANMSGFRAHCVKVHVRCELFQDCIGKLLYCHMLFMRYLHLSYVVCCYI